MVQTDDGLRYKLDNGTEHKSPSSAGKAAMGGVACNGWRFWTVQGTETPKTKRAPKPKTEKPAKAPAKKKSAKKSPAKAMRAKASDASYGCGVCNETFPTQKAAIAHAMTHTS